MASSSLPAVPAKHSDFIPYLTSNSDKPLAELLEPYKQYDAKLREVFAQEPNHPILADHHVNVVPVFAGHEENVKIHARQIDIETDEEKAKYVMSLKDEDRKPNGSPAIAQDIKSFQQNFSLFSESSLVDLDWNNVVAAGSSVVTCLLPVPQKYNTSKRALRQYYHEIIAPASDVDLFLYELTEEEAIKKIIQIEQKIKDSILTETTTIRTKNVITIASQYPTRHIQIVLRIYKSVSEILTGFDVDCSCAAYDGKQVYASPRALSAYMTQCNTVDLSRRSPSYENRLSKYSHRGFEVYWPLLDRSRIDPTIFERNFARTLGLARLLVLEKLPKSNDRDSYMDQRRLERGRPEINRYNRYARRMRGNIKAQYEDEIAEWVDQDDVSDYHTFTIPYGQKFNARKIERLLFTKDLLLNAEWNKPDDREAIDLHRHPAFFGQAEDVIHDCCGYCPKPVTYEEEQVAVEEAKVYVSGEISFIKDDPGRQAIGSFNPITDDDWTEMAYVGNTARLCQAIVDGDLEHVEDWLAQEDSDPNCRDYTGRTPLHLAVLSSTAEVVQCLINHGARLVARLADGRTALHLSAARGNVDMVKMILQKSEENEEEEAKKEDLKKQARITAKPETSQKKQEMQSDGSEESDEEIDIEMIDAEDEDTEMRSTTTGSYVKVKPENKDESDLVPEEEEDEPDFYDVNVLAWDTACSPLHLAIISGHCDVVKELVQTFGADVLLPIKLFNTYNKSPRAAILTLVLCLQLPLETAKAMTQTLLELGASSAQADMNQTTALHYISGKEPELLETMFQHDEPAARRAINHLSVSGSHWDPSSQSPLMSAIAARNSLAALKLLLSGANQTIDFTDYIKSIQTKYEDVASRDSKRNHEDFLKTIEQPITLAVQAELPSVALQLLSRGADPNTLTSSAQRCILDEWQRRYSSMDSLLDLVRAKIRDLRDFKVEQEINPPELLVKEEDYLKDLQPGSYKYYIADKALQHAKKNDKQALKGYQTRLEARDPRQGAEKKEAIQALVAEYQQLEDELLNKGAKVFKELHPDVFSDTSNNNNNQYQPYVNKPKPFQVEFNFNIHDLTDEKREAYLKLYQGAWSGDLATIKSLTLAPWGSEGTQTPLKITITDTDGQSPFSLAILRGHRDLARAILEIALAQYQPEEKKGKERYKLGAEDNDYEDSQMTDPSDDDLQVYKEIVDDQFTIDNIGEISTQVKSNVTPHAFLNWTCNFHQYMKYFEKEPTSTYMTTIRKIKPYNDGTLIQYAIFSNDMELFTYLLELEIEWTDRLSNEGSPFIPSFSQAEFDLAIACGRLPMLGEMIKHTGASMSLESFIKKSGVKFEEKPKYYQGLSVHGKKRADWAAAARGTSMQIVQDKNPPALQAAFKGNLDSVEWFLSDTPARYYQDFAEANKSDKRIKHLNESAGGFDKVLFSWLGARRELIIHCAVLSKPSQQSTRLLEYLIKAVPGSLHTKSSAGLTPLALAFSLRRLAAARALIAAGADQTMRDHTGNNILHLLFCSAYNFNCSNKYKLQESLDLVDKRLIDSLLTERSSEGPGASTPLSRWMHFKYSNRNRYYVNVDEDKDSMTILNQILNFATPTNNEHLELLDGAGDTPLHQAIKCKLPQTAQLILLYRPDLVYRENATGRTPAEMAEDAYIAHCAKDPPNLPNLEPNSGIITEDASNFVKNREPKDDRPMPERIWALCKEYMGKNPSKRRLVSLFEANEVAKRLASRQSGYSRNYRRARDDDDDGEEDEEHEVVTDEVAQWYNIAIQSFEYEEEDENNQWEDDMPPVPPHFGLWNNNPLFGQY